jgi:hypothetical protein
MRPNSLSMLTHFLKILQIPSKSCKFPQNAAKFAQNPDKFPQNADKLSQEMNVEEMIREMFSIQFVSHVKLIQR